MSYIILCILRHIFFIFDRSNRDENMDICQRKMRICECLKYNIEYFHAQSKTFAPNKMRDAFTRNSIHTNRLNRLLGFSLKKKLPFTSKLFLARSCDERICLTGDGYKIYLYKAYTQHTATHKLFVIHPNQANIYVCMCIYACMDLYSVHNGKDTNFQTHAE